MIGRRVGWHHQWCRQGQRKKKKDPQPQLCTEDRRVIEEKVFCTWMKKESKRVREQWISVSSCCEEQADKRRGEKVQENKIMFHREKKNMQRKGSHQRHPDLIQKQSTVSRIHSEFNQSHQIFNLLYNYFRELHDVRMISQPCWRVKEDYLEAFLNLIRYLSSRPGRWAAHLQAAGPPQALPPIRRRWSWGPSPETHAVVFRWTSSSHWPSR